MEIMAAQWVSLGVHNLVTGARGKGGGCEPGLHGEAVMGEGKPSKGIVSYVPNRAHPVGQPGSSFCCVQVHSTVSLDHSQRPGTVPR